MHALSKLFVEQPLAVITPSSLLVHSIPGFFWSSVKFSEDRRSFFPIFGFGHRSACTFLHLNHCSVNVTVDSSWLTWKMDSRSWAFNKSETLLRNLPLLGCFIIPHIPEGCLQRDIATSMLCTGVAIRLVIRCLWSLTDIAIFMILFIGTLGTFTNMHTHNKS